MTTNDSSAARRWTDDDDLPPEESSGRRCNFWCLGFVFLIIGIVGAAVIIALYVIPGCVRLQYGVVMDAGSSHTSMSIYRWAGQKLRGTGEVIEIIQCNVAGDGISSYQDNPPGAGKSLTECLESGKKLVPKDRHGVTPIYLGATAGMRILKNESPVKADKVFKSVENTFKESGFKYTDGNVRMVSDQEEGIYAWISANLLQGTLGQEGTQVPTTGTLDMGGASTQIAFQTSERKPGIPEDYQTLRLYGFDFPVFTHSYLCFGQKEVIRRLKAQAILDANTPTSRNYDLSCFHRGNNEETDAMNEIFGKACTVPIPDNLKSLENEQIRFRGTGDVQNCYKEVKKLLDPEECKRIGYKYCLDSSIIPKIEGKFRAMSTFFYAADAINATKANHTEFIKAAEDFCKMPWDKVIQGPVAKQFASRFCFTTIFVVEFVGNVYGFAGNRWKDVEFTRKIAGVSLGWDLGFMTNATNTIPTEKVSLISTELFVALLIVFIVIILLVVILGFRAWTQHRSRTRKIDNDNSCLALCCPKK